MRRTELAYRRLTLGRVVLRAAPVLPPWRIVELGRVFSRPKPIVRRIPGLLTIAKPQGLEEPAIQLDWLRRIRPQIVEGFPTALEVLARACQKESWRIPRPRVVISRGEVLFPDVRQLIADAFSAPVVDHYNSEEIGNIAWQCPLDPERMHINSDTCFLEIVDSEGRRLPPGEPGSIALTNLYDYTMPFIRYTVGDRGMLLPDADERCRCGSRGPSMALLEGREDDILRMPVGSLVSPRVIVTAMFWHNGEAIPGVHRYQLIQRLADRLEVRVILENAHAPDWREKLLAGAQRAMPGVELDIRQVDSIPLDASGKYKRVICSVPREE